MTASEYLNHAYVMIAAKTYHDAVQAFYAKRNYAPAPVFGAVGCGDALESRFVRPGFYHCALRPAPATSPHEPIRGNCPWQACTPCDLVGRVGCDQTCRYYPYDGRAE